MNNDNNQNQTNNQPPPPPTVDDPGSAIPTSPPPAPNMGSESEMPPPVVVEETPQNQIGGVQNVTTTGGGGRKISKKTVAAILGVLLLVIGAVSGLLLVQRQQDIREQAGSVGGVACTTPNGLELQSRSSPGEAGDLGYRPIPQTYTVGEVVTFNVHLLNTSNTSVTDQYHFTANKVLEAPVGQTPAPNLTEEEMYAIHGDPSQGTTQVNHFDGGFQSYNVPASGQATVTGSWVSDECGYFQLDMALEEFATCTDTEPSGFGVVAAGFIQVVGCSAPQPTPTTPSSTPPPPDFPTPPPTAPPGGTPPPPPQQQASCTDIRIYDENDVQLTTAQLTELSAGDTIKIVVNGASTAESSFDRGRFRIQTNLDESLTDANWIESSQSDGGNSYYYLYTIPSDATSFTIDAQMHHSSLGWL